jgi:hypothetical protein
MFERFKELNPNLKLEDLPKGEPLQPPDDISRCLIDLIKASAELAKAIYQLTNSRGGPNPALIAKIEKRLNWAEQIQSKRETADPQLAQIAEVIKAQLAGLKGHALKKSV